MARSVSGSPKKPTKPANKTRKSRSSVSESVSPRKPPAKSPAVKKKKATTKAKTTSEDTDDEKTPAARISWDLDKYPHRQDRLLDALEKDVGRRVKLFSDSNEAAKADGRKKKTGKTAKTNIYNQIAKEVFEKDDDEAVRQDVVANPARYGKAVDNFLAR
jgi:sugar-specific transcriptional regulator TrmB